ncbi:MAG: UbiA family prenyltransferase [Anaerolineales bacterium]
MSRLFALSRTSHGLLDMAAPAFCALVWLGQIPSWQTILLALATGFAAYTSIYALNDLMGMRTDREKCSGCAGRTGFSVEASPDRYPLARNVLSMRSAALWTAGWFAAALAGSYVLNPTIMALLVGAAGLEVVYCLLLKVTYLRTLISGLVKSSGPIAAVLVIDPRPAPGMLLLLFAWVFFWEIGGQNIPSDWNDTAEDKRVSAKTIPICFGCEKAGLVIMAALALSVAASVFLPVISPARLGWRYAVISLLLGYVLLLRPAVRLLLLKEGRLAARLFDMASFYPLAQFAVIATFLLGDRFVW